MVGAVERLRVLLGDMSRTLRWSFLGALLAGSAGAVVGLVQGLGAYPPTAWFAVLELGAPAGILGALIGLAAAGATSRRAGSSSSRQTLCRKAAP